MIERERESEWLRERESGNSVKSLRLGDDDDDDDIYLYTIFQL